MKLEYWNELDRPDWYEALDILEQQWFAHCVQKRGALLDEMTNLTAELNRLRSRGRQRLYRGQKAGNA